jgi:hypothetical protein
LLHGLNTAAATDAAAGAAAAAVPGGFASAVLSAGVQQMEALVAEDVERLQQQWQRQERPKLQAGAAEIWHE